MNTFLNVLMSFLFNSVIFLYYHMWYTACLIHVLSLSQNVQHFPLGLCYGTHHSTCYDHILDNLLIVWRSAYLMKVIEYTHRDHCIIYLCFDYGHVLSDLQQIMIRAIFVPIMAAKLYIAEWFEMRCGCSFSISVEMLTITDAPFFS
jgi:hypothetical protein